MLTTSSTALFLFFITISTFPSLPESQVRVKSKRHSVQRTEGQPLSLKCTAEYEEEQCGNVRVSWCFGNGVDCQRLTDPDKYVIHINETKAGGNRTQDAFISFTQLNVTDSGYYKCEAACQNNGATAMGHAIFVTVTDGDNSICSTGDVNKDQKIPDRSSRCGVDMFLLTISVFFLLWIN